MRGNLVVTSLSIAALVFAAGPAYAQTSADKPTMKEKVEQKADQAGEKGMALTISELHQLAAEARAVGFREIEVKEQPEPGIQARGYFFTATELASIVNAGFFVNGMFEAIVARRIKPAARKGE